MSTSRPAHAADLKFSKGDKNAKGVVKQEKERQKGI
jgi:hypothetical protein